MFPLGSICLLVCWVISWTTQKTTEGISMKLQCSVGLNPEQTPLTFGVNTNKGTDPGTYFL